MILETTVLVGYMSGCSNYVKEAMLLVRETLCSVFAQPRWLVKLIRAYLPDWLGVFFFTFI
jgi:hypothetical protein